MTLEDSTMLRKKGQMSGAGGARDAAHCGLSSLLPGACRGRAAAFARDLHTRLRTLGNTPDSRAWHAPATAQDARNFYDFECESPSSPLDESDLAFRKRLDDRDPPFYDIDSDDDAVRVENPFRGDYFRNGFKCSSPYESPVKRQPVPRENGHALYSPISFEDCARKISDDVVDAPSSSPLPPSDDYVSQLLDSDSDFESAKSDPSDGVSDDVIISDIDEAPPTSTQLEDVKKNYTVTEPDESDNTFENNELIDSSKDSRREDNGTEEVFVIDADVSIEVDVHDDTENERPHRVRRCSSLKSGKTPPGTPGRKKIVRFADVLGLDLADVKTFMDDIPVIPKSAYDDLTDCDLQNSPPARMQFRLGALTLVPLFQLPRDVTEKLEKQNVCLESARVCEGVHVTVCGSVRVRNLDFHKTVHIRYSMNQWRSFTDLQAVYVQGSCDGYSDRFQFILYAPCINSGQRLELAVRFQCKGQQFWDNNCGLNYCFDCLALGATMQSFNTGPLHPTVDWHPSFY